MFSETQIKLIELVEEFNFKIFYFSCKPATKNKLSIKDGYIDLTNNDVEKIKHNQSKDFFYFYENQICEVFYSFLKLDKDNNYYFDFMLVVNKNFDLKSVYNYNFKSIEIESVKEIRLHEINFEWVQFIFEKRVITYNNSTPVYNESHYNLSNLNYGLKNYENNIKMGSSDFDYEEYTNFNSFYYYKRFDQNKSVIELFSLLSSQIWSMDRFFYKEKNKYGFRVSYYELYNLNSPFLTNFAELVGCLSVNFNSNDENKINFNKVDYTYCSLSDNTIDQGIILISFSPIYLNNKKIDFENLKIVNKNE